ncbi:MAG TPA: LysM peptidoglycan-binding domain-containing M23 family metallopeptidase [Trueperaceae bacterium]
MTIKKLVRPLVVSLLFAGTSALAGGYAIRTVQPGDSLGSIANLYNMSVEELADFNQLDTTLIHPGDVLRVPFVEARGGAAERAPKPPPGFHLHVLAPGETISSLTETYGISLEAIVGANPDISSLDMLPVGLELLIPPGEGLVVTLEPGQSVLDIVKAYGVSPMAIAKANDIDSPGDLQPGEMLFLPGVKPVAAMDRLAKVREMENRYIWPVHGRLTSYFGRRHLGMGTSNFHKGLDIAAPYGTPVRAARTGTVVYAGWSNAGYGNMVEIRHFGGAETLYGHFSKILVHVGQRVNQGEVIGRVGSTGISTGPHVHFEVHEGGRAYDPLSYLH